MKKKIGSFRKVIRERAGRTLVVGAVFALVLANIMPAFKAFAINDGSAYAEIFMRGATGASTESGITFTYEGGTVAVTGATDPVVELDENWNYGDHVGELYKLYTKSSSLVFTPTATNGNAIRVFSGADGQNQEVSLTNGQYNLDSLVTKGNSGPTYDVEFQFSGGAPQPGNTQATIDYTYSGVSGLDVRMNGRFIPVGEQQFDGNNHVNFSTDYDTEQGDTTVTFTFETLWIYVIDGLTVNGVSPELPDTEDELIAAYDGHQHVAVEVEVPISDTYIITSHTHEAEGEEIFMGNFLWDNDTSKLDTLAENDERRDDIIGHGTFEFVRATYKGTTYNSVAEMEAAGKIFAFGEDPDGTGYATFPVGTELTIRLLPEPGYQLTSFGINGGVFEPQENVGEYTFTIRPGNGHFAADFTEVEDAVTAGAEAVESGSIELGEGELDYGTAVLEVEEANLDDDDIAGFRNAAGDYQVSTYLDISLYQVTYKGTNDVSDAWKDQLNNLEKEATITLQLEEGVDGNEIVIVHQKHDGSYEIIPTVYDPVAHTITFKASSFSNYAIAARTVAKETNETTVKSPDTGFLANGGDAAKLALSGVVVMAAVSLGVVRVVASRKK